MLHEPHTPETAVLSYSRHAVSNLAMCFMTCVSWNGTEWVAPKDGSGETRDLSAGATLRAPPKKRSEDMKAERSPKFGTTERYKSYSGRGPYKFMSVRIFMTNLYLRRAEHAR